MNILQGQLIQPLTLDISAFKRRYNSLINLSSYERANKIGLEQKRLKWAAYRPLASEQLYDTFDDNISITILNPLASRAPKRSTRNGAMYEQTTVIHRPTEILAIIHAMGLYKFESEDIVIRQDPNRIVRWCITCKSFKALEMFAKDRSNLSGLAFACNRCRDDGKRRIFKRAA